MIRQVSEPCPKCGRHWRDGDRCSNPQCGILAPAPPNIGPLPDGNDPSFSREGKESRGLGWDKKRHKVIY